MTRVRNPQVERTPYQHDPVGRAMTLTHDNGTVATHAYGAAGRMTGLTNKRSGGSTMP